jgi:ABC transport system ATP-binding/permease protein
MLPRGVDEYLERRTAALAAAQPVAGPAGPRADEGPSSQPRSTRDARKAVARIERRLAKLSEREAELHALLVQHASDYERLADLGAQLDAVTAEKSVLEEEWLDAAALLE